MSASLENFFNMSAPAKAVMIGDMGELGDSSAEEHEKILKLLTDSSIDKIFLVGKEFEKALSKAGDKADARILWFGSSDSLVTYLTDNQLRGFTILIKGSHSMRMEKTVQVL